MGISNSRLNDNKKQLPKGGPPAPEIATLIFVKELEKRWREVCGMPFAMRQKSTQGESGIDRLFLQQSSLSTKFVESLHSAFRRGPGGSEARVDVLSLLSVYYIFCQGSTKDKVKAIFSLFDFNRNGSMSQDELTIMFISSFYGICGYLSLDLEENIESICERMAFETFRYKHNENPQHKFNSIDHIEFLDFLIDRIDADNDGISAVEIVRFFQTGVVPQSNVAKLCVQEESELGIKYEDDFDIETQYSQGDEFMAIRPWLGAVKSPSKNIPTNNSIPDASLELDWVYGYRCYDVRNNLRYVETGEIVYPCAAVVVLFDPKTRSQNFLQGHDDDVVSLDISKDRTKIVTGETGRHPCLMVWHAKSRKLMTTLRSRSLRRAVVAVSFSKSGNRVVAVGQDDRHTVHVFCLNTGICMAKCPTERTRVMTCLFVNDENVILGGLKHARHLILRTNASHKTRTQSKRLLFGKIGSRTILCSQNFQDMIVCGTSTGELIVWDINKKSREPVKLVSLCKDSSINNQDECVNALWCSAGADSRTLLYAGSKCGRVWILNRTFDIVQTYDIKSSSSSCSVRSVCVTPDEKSILVGTQGGEIIEISSGNDKEQNILIESHFYGETRGLAVHPRKLICATSGDDKTVRVWDMKSHKQLHITILNSFVRSLAYSPSGHHLACGTGGRFKGKSTGPQGHVVVLDTFSMKPVRTLKDSKKWIRVLTYSPDGSWLAVGSQDYNIYIYDTDDEYRLRHVLRRHNSHVSCLDFTEDSKHLRSVCGGNELLFWDARRGKPMPGGATSLRDATWHTTTCPLVWSTQGILDTDPKSLCVSRNERCDLVVSGDSKGVLSLLNYPCPKTPWCRSEFLGHGSYIPCVRFTRRDVYVVSVGGADRGIFQWRVQRESSSTSLTPTISSPTTTKETYELEQYEGKGDNLMASKPWLGAIKAPSEPPNIRNESSSSYLELAWVHGCSTRPRSVQYLSRLGVLAYSTAAIVVLHELNSKSQNYFRGYHTGRINSMAFSNDETICATGGVGRNPSIYIWCTRTRKIVTRLEGHRRSIDALAFSPNKQYLVSVGGESNRLMFLYERTTKNGPYKILVKKQRIGNDKVTDISVDNDGNCVSVGVRHACRWQLQNCRFKRRKILAKKIANLRQELCCSTMFQNGKICVLGATNGDVYICKDRTIVRKIVAHNGAVRVIFAESDSSFLTAGADGYVKRFSLEHDKNSESVVMEIPKADIVCLSRDHDDSIILTTSRAEIYRCATEDSKQNLLLSCHYGNEICGVVALSSSECASCGEDGTVRVWNLEHHKQICVRDVGGRATSISYDPTEKRLVVCVQRHHKDKTIELVELDASTLKELRRLETKARKPCRVIKVSPDGRWIALGSNDHKIYLHDSTELKCRHVLGKHNAVVQNLDWTSDSRYLHSTCAGHELLFWDAERGQHMPGGATTLRDAEWASWTCTLGWPVSGLNALMDISCVSASEDLVVYGDLTGNLQLARFPSPETPWRHETYYGHGSRVTSLAWSSDRSTIVSIGGGEDRSLFIWRLVEVNNLDVDEKKSMPTEEIESISKEEETSPSKEEEKNVVLSSLSSSKEEEETLPLKNEEEDEQETVSSTKEESSSNEEEDKVPASKEGGIPTRSTQSTTKNQQQEPTPDDDSEHEEEEDFSQGVHEPTLAVPKYSAPELDLEWIYGIRSFDRFDNVKYVSSRSCEDVVCHSGKICVVYNKIKKNQRFYFGHTRDVSCITTHPVLPIVASGEEGGEKEGGAIHIWNTTTMSTLAVLEGVHMGTILSLRFDPHGDRVLSVGQEIVAFYEWSNQARPSRCSGRTDLDQKSRVKPECIMSTQGETILHCSELQDEGNIIRCVFVTSRFVRRVRCDGTNLRWSRMSSAKKVQFTCCVNDDEENTLIGTSCGKLGLLSSSNTLELLVDAHKSCVNTLLKLSNIRVLSGGEDGTIKMWNTPFTKPTLLQSFDLSFYTNFAAVRSLDQNDEDENIILASTIDSSVLELDMTKTTSMISLLLSGISSALTTALATTSKSTRVVVGSDDRTVTVWDMNTHTPEISRTVSNRVCDIDVSANDEWVAVSVHSDNASNLGIHILGLKKLEDITHISNIEKDSCWFTVLRYSTDNKMLAAGTNKGIIRVYDTTNKYAVLHTLKQHIPSCLVSLDWTHDSTFLQTYDTNKNVMFWDIKHDGVLIHDGAKALRDADWQSWTCPKGFPVKDLYDNNNDDDDNDDDTKRNVTTLARSRCGTKLAVGLRMGTIRSYGFPCMSSSFDEDEAHVSRDVKCVRWSSEDTFVLSLAKSDRSFLQWRVKTDENNNNNNTEIVEKIIAKNKNEKDEEEEWILENSQEGDNYMSVLPWLGAVKAPTIPELLTQDKTRPKYDMRKSWIYGISCRNMRNFVRYDAVNDVVYPASACSIKYDPDTNRQDHNSDHTNTITAFAISSDGKIAATGQRGRDAVVIVWCTRTMKSLATLRGHRRAVVQIAFSNDGKTVASAGADDGHTVLVHNWQSERKQKIRTGQNLLLHLCFSGNNSMFVAAGKKCVYFFESKGRSNARWRKRRAGIVSGSKVKGELERFTGVCFVDDEDDLKSKRVLVTVGTPTKQSGQIYEFDSSTKRLMAIHNVTSSPILAIHSHKLLRTIAIGCVDGTVCVIDSTSMNTLRVLSFETSIRSVCQSLLDNKILVGTDRGQIFEATGVKTLTKLLESHFGGEICGVVTSPSSSECASCGEDGTVRVWNLERHEQICVRDVGGRATSITYDPTGKRLVVCVQHHHKDNTINLVELDAITLKELRRLETKARKPCRVVQFSPDGRMIALASNDHNIYLHASANLKCRHVLGKHNAVVQNLDWTSDSRYLHSTCAGHELLFWDAERGQHMPGGATTLRDAEWASWTCTLGWPVKGLDVNTEDQSICFVSASNNSKLLVCGYDTGNVRLVHYPCPDSAGSVLKRGHASKMCRADWIHGGTSSKLGFVTAGSRDAALIQWNLYMSSDTSSSMSS